MLQIVTNKIRKKLDLCQVFFVRSSMVKDRILIKTMKVMKDLDIKASSSSRSGEKIPNDSTVSFVRRSISNINVADDRKPSSVNSFDFNPKASVIEIDGRTQESRDSQVVKIVNRSYNSII